MKNSIVQLLKSLLPFTLLLYFSQKLITSNFFEEFNFFYSIKSLFIFHFLITLIVCILLIVVYHLQSEKFGFAFMALSLFKMIASIIYLIPLFKNLADDYISDVFFFFIPYFLFLFFELIFAMKLLNIPKK